MTNTELVGFLGILVAVASSIGLPLYLLRRKTKGENATAQAAAAATDVVSWQGITAVMKEERDASVKRVGEVEKEYAEKFRKLEAEYAEKFRRLEEDCTRKVEASNRRIRELEVEVTGLYREIHGLPPR
jgi:hypothetical protein